MMGEKAVATTSTPLPTKLQDEIRAYLPAIKEVLPADITVDQFRAATWLALSSQPKVISECTPESTRQAIVKAATYGLLPERDCHFLPFKTRGKMQTTFIPNYQGIQRALDRTGKVKKSFAQAVYDNDVFVVDVLADVYSHQPNIDNPGKLRCFYGCVIMKDGAKHVQVMTLADVERIKERAPAHESGPWSTDYVAMGRKTALKQAAKYVNLSPAIQQMLSEDENRQATDIPAARVQQHIVDLFGDEDGGNPTAYNTVTGEIVGEKQAEMPLHDPQPPAKTKEPY